MSKKEIKTACFACHGGCSAIVETEDGKVLKIYPDPDGPLNHGKMCPKGLHGTDLLYHPDHLNYPLLRAGERGEGKWTRISWNHAFSILCEKYSYFKDHYGANSITVMTGTGRHLKNQVARFANAIGTSNMVSTGASICFGPRVNAMMATYGTYAVTDYYSGSWPGSILIWGSNPLNASPDGKMMWNTLEAYKHGSKLIVIDPLPTELTPKASLWLKIRPGTDGALALGLLHIILEEKLYNEAFCKKWVYGLDRLQTRCKDWTPERVSSLTDIPVSQIIECAHMLSSCGTIGLDWGCAVEQTSNAFGCIRAMALIPALLGSWDVPGGFREGEDFCPECDPWWDRTDRELRMGSEFKLCPYAHVLPVLRSMSSSAEDRIRAAFIFGTNPLLCVPDAQETFHNLKDLEFSVCMDQFMTPTAALCDLVLPAASWLEIENLITMPAMAEHTLLAQRQLTRVGERKSDGEVFIEFCRRLNIEYGADSIDDILNSQLDHTRKMHPEFKDICLDDIRKSGHISPTLTFQKYEKRGHFNTPTGKIEAFSTILEQQGFDPLPDYSEIDFDSRYPYILTTGRRIKSYFISENRQIPSLRSLHPFPECILHPLTAEKLGIQNGDWVWIETAKGKITQKAHLSEGGDPSVINCEMGWWYPEAGCDTLYDWNLSNCNVIIEDGLLDKTFGDYNLRGLRCNIKRNPDASYIESRYNNWISTFKNANGG